MSLARRESAGPSAEVRRNLEVRQMPARRDVGASDRARSGLPAPPLSPYQPYQPLSLAQREPLAQRHSIHTCEYQCSAPSASNDAREVRCVC